MHSATAVGTQASTHDASGDPRRSLPKPIKAPMAPLRKATSSTTSATAATPSHEKSTRERPMAIAATSQGAAGVGFVSEVLFVFFAFANADRLCVFVTVLGLC